MTEHMGIPATGPGERDADRNLFSEAMIGGRLLTERLADELYGGHPELGRPPSDFIHDRLSGAMGPEVTRQFWADVIDPAAGWTTAIDGYRHDREVRMRTKVLNISEIEAMTEWPIIRAAILQQALEPILFAEGAETEWNSSTASNVAMLISRPMGGPCPTCGHPLVDGQHNPDAEDPSCETCDELAQTGQYAPCQTSAFR